MLEDDHAHLHVIILFNQKNICDVLNAESTPRKSMNDSQESPTIGQETMAQNWKRACTDFVQQKPCTSSIVGLCVLAFMVETLAWKSSVEIGGLSAGLVVQKFQLWRVVTYCILHANIAHLVLNMIALLQLGFTMEARMGPIGFLKANVLVNLIGASLYCFLCYALDFAISQSSFTKTIVIGYSGVLFGLVSVESIRAGISNAAKVNLYGVVHVPKWAVPWCLVVLMYLLVPGSSILGHISGILGGYIFRAVFFTRDDDFVDEDWVLGQYVSLPQ